MTSRGPACLALLLAGCVPAGPAPDAGAAMRWHEERRATDIEVSAALNGAGGADYPRAIAAIERSGRPRSVIDRQVGDLILSAHRDGLPATMPAQPAAEGIARLEATAAANGEAAAGARQSLRLWFERGAGAALPPDPALARCWGEAAAGRRGGAACVALRQQR
ncbi:MAG TPA: hypothetical protein VGM87_11435 [Roseomonas sp.]